MIQRTWTRRRGHSAKPGLDGLPGRAGPSSLAGAEVCLLLGTACGGGLPSAAMTAESPPTAPFRAGAPLAGAPTADRAGEMPTFSRDEPADGEHEGVEPPAAAAWPAPTVEAFRFTPVPTAGQESPAGPDRVSVTPTTQPPSQPAADEPAGVVFTAFPPVPVVAVVPPVRHNAPPRPPAAKDVPTPAEAVPEPDVPVVSPDESAVIVETPPTFLGGEESVEPMAGAVGMVPDAAADPSPMVRIPDRFGEQATAEASNVTVTPRPDAGGRPLVADAAVFRISGSPAPGEKLEVRYTLAAHAAGGTVSVDGAVTLTSGANHAAVAPGPALAGRPAELLTIILRDHPGVRPAKASATLVIAPAGDRVGDSALFEAHRLGRSPEAFDALTQRHGPAVSRVCQRIVGNRADAEDVTQLVFLALAQWQARFPGPLTGWLHTVAKNASLAFLRSKARRLRHEREAAKPVRTEPADAAGTVDDDLAAAIRQLPAPLEQAVRLRYLEGWSQQEAAQIVGCPRGTLSRRAADGIRVLRELLENDPAAVG